MSTPKTISALIAKDQAEATQRAVPADLRLVRRNPGIAGGYVAGGWWPRSLDLSVELPPLLAEMFSAGYDVRRVTYNITAWNAAPRLLIVVDRLVKLGGYRTQDVATISLLDSSGWKRMDLVVVPPETDSAIAERALAQAGLDGDSSRAGHILEHAHLKAGISHTGCVDVLPASAWGTDSGRTLAS
jgi:hypothetical protein